ncbi:hypothetical protein LGQ03_15175 [Loktanella sp. TSTF-M6]|uniref:Protein kinase domain-containing protein n=1 Tax=Loktanella gaetbuli TaxID=2881335 RepID=A0ABS8BXW7_9RHOB|nr:hypothetical protein [Loktanella gaetbuli]MCB5200582.1 hypothetical protein [Loktanella gaetbuli]
MTHHALLDRIEQHYRFDRNTFETYGSSNVHRGVDKNNERHEVTIYVPEPEVMKDAKARSELFEQFQRYNSSHHPATLPVPYDIVEIAPKKGKDGMALVLKRATVGGFFGIERDGGGRSWFEGTNIPYAQRQGAAVAFLDGVNALENMDLRLPEFGVSTTQVVPDGNGVKLLIDLVYFPGTSPLGRNTPHEPAFTAPERVANGSAQPASGPDRVYSLAALLIYFLAGPVGFAKVFSAPEVTTKDDVLPMLQNIDFWVNRAERKVGIDDTALRAATDNEMSLDLAALFARATSPVPDDRFGTVDLFISALRNTLNVSTAPVVGAGLGAAGMGTGMPPKKSKFGMLTAAAIGSVLLVGSGGLWYVDKLEKDRIAAERAAAMNEAAEVCGQMAATFETLGETGFATTADWDALVADRTALPPPDTTDNIRAAVRDCPQINARATALAGDYMAGLQTALEDEIAFAAENPAMAGAPALNDARAVAELGDAADLPIAEREAGIITATDALIAAHMATLQDRATALAALRDEVAGIWSLPADANDTGPAFDALGAAAAQDTSAPALRTLSEAQAAGESALMSGLTRDLGAQRQDLLDEIADLRASLGESAQWSALEADIADLPNQPQALTSEAVQAVYAAVAQLQGAVGEAGGQGAQALSEIAELRDTIATLADGAGQAGYDDVDEWQTATAAMSELPVNPDALPRWADLTTQLSTLDAELAAEWQAGRAQCDSFAAEYAEQAALLTTWDEAQALDTARTAAAQVTDGEADREAFAACAAGLPQLTAATIRAQGKSVLNDAAEAYAAAEEVAGLTEIPGNFDLAERAAELAATAVPETADALADLRDRAADLTAEIAARTTALERAQAQRQTLASENEALTAGIAETGLGTHPAYVEAVAGFGDPDAVDILSGNSMLAEQNATLRKLVSDFDAGALLNCTFEGYDMAALVVRSEDLAALPAAYAPQEGSLDALAGQHCVGMAPVTLAEVQAWGDGLQPNQAAVLTEIAATTQAETSETATNISGFLALSYARHLSEQSGEAVCLVPAPLVALISQADPASAGVEMTGTACGESSVARPFYAGVDTAAPLEAPTCLDGQSRLPEVGFRLAFGAICAGE